MVGKLATATSRDLPRTHSRISFPSMNRQSLLFLPSAISLSRLVLAAVFIGTSSATGRVALVVVAAFTDFLDGWLARHANLTTKWGALIDPIADRIFVWAQVRSPWPRFWHGAGNKPLFPSGQANS